MLYNLTALATAKEKIIAGKIIAGGERVLYASNEQTKRIGEFFLTGDGSGVYYPDPIWGTADLSTNPSDLQVVSLDGFKSNAAVQFTVSGTGSDSSPLTGSGVFTPPSWSRNQKFDFEKGVAKDITPSRAGVTFKVINTVTVTNALRGSTFRVLALPSAASWVEIDKIEGVGVNHSNRPGVPIPEGLDGTDEVTMGRSGVQSLSISGHNRGVADGLQRYAGQFCSIRCDILGQQKIPKETQIYGNAILEVNPSYGSGGDLSTQAADGCFEDLAIFYAP